MNLNLTLFLSCLQQRVNSWPIVCYEMNSCRLRTCNRFAIVKSLEDISLLSRFFFRGLQILWRWGKSLNIFYLCLSFICNTCIKNSKIMDHCQKKKFFGENKNNGIWYFYLESQGSSCLWFYHHTQTRRLLGWMCEGAMTYFTIHFS